ncbi:GNAT family N-acetyltransferase [Paenibacillus sp. JX-17]|uniref:GNAT family N-acetyltransferase n=1 Tax=Paenibacillus lacisoli TaxID=3064525 RepID=A0ABT9CCJ3_9BACL|nr:GNAT family N-acetyltransferase [Paenibacillus sp. JX-17]MDO7906961.1 GNAT family N-acetyltransferase [Paenibacillus sp. JX-17]
MTAIEIREKQVQEGIEAVPASQEDQDQVRDLLLDTARWLQSTGSTQWSNLLKGEDSHDTPAAIRREEVILFRDQISGELAGMVILQQQPSDWDRRLWKVEHPEEDTAVYLHRLAVNRNYARSGLGRNILKWAQSHVHYTGKDRLRLDCGHTNEKLNHLYQSCGFMFMGEEDDFSLYEYSLKS